MHAIEKILARGFGLSEVRTGQIANCDVDIAGINDLYLQSIYSFREMGGEKVAVPDNVVVFLTTEMGAKTAYAYIQPDELTFEHLKKVGATEYTVYTTDGDFVYWAEHTYDISEIEPQLAVPSSVDNVEGISAHEGTPIDQAFFGTCTGSRLDDIALAAHILKGRKIHRNTRMLIVPASKEVLLQAIERGYMQTLVEANATFVTPGCAACLGTHEGLIAKEEVCITTSSRNFPGRMGHTQGRIYWASPAAVAASALVGKITDPRKYL